MSAYSTLIFLQLRAINDQIQNGTHHVYKHIRSYCWRQSGNVRLSYTSFQWAYNRLWFIKR